MHGQGQSAVEVSTHSVVDYSAPAQSNELLLDHRGLVWDTHIFQLRSDIVVEMSKHSGFG